MGKRLWLCDVASVADNALFEIVGGLRVGTKCPEMRPTAEDMATTLQVGIPIHGFATLAREGGGSTKPGQPRGLLDKCGS